MNVLEEVKSVSAEERKYCEIIREKQEKLEESILDLVEPIFDSHKWTGVSLLFPDQRHEKDDELFGDPVVLSIHAQKLSPLEFDDIDSGRELDVFDKITIFFETQRVWILYEPDTVAGSCTRKTTYDLQVAESIESYIEQSMQKVVEWEKDRIKTRTRVALWREGRKADEELEDD